MEKLKWIFDNLDEEALPAADCCACTTKGPDTGGPVCQYLTDHLVVVTPGSGCGTPPM